VARQETECRELAEREGWEVLEVLTDNDISAYSGKRRPAYERMLELIRAREADAIVAWHTDRLYRRTRDLAQLIDITNEHKIAIRTVTSGDIDLSNASGRMVARVVAAAAEHEIEHGQERMRAAKADAATRGIYRGSSRPFGYEPDGVTAREAEAKEVRNATRAVLEGVSLKAILRDWLERDVPTSKGGTWALPALRYVLVRARNAGLIERHGEIVGPAQWPAIVPEHEWRAVRTILLDPARNTKPGTRSRVWLGSGLFLCGVCNDGTTVRVGTTGGANRGSAYRCRTGRHVSRTAPTIDAYVSDVVVEFLESRRGHLDLTPGEGEDVAALRAEAQSIRLELDRLRTALGERSIDLRTFQIASGEMTADLEVTEEKLRKHLSRTPLAALADAPDMRKAWDAMDVDRKRAVIDFVFSVTLLPVRPGRKPGGQYFDPGSVQVKRKPLPGLARAD